MPDSRGRSGLVLSLPKDPWAAVMAPDTSQSGPENRGDDVGCLPPVPLLPRVDKEPQVPGAASPSERRASWREVTLWCQHCACDFEVSRDIKVLLSYLDFHSKSEPW